MKLTSCSLDPTVIYEAKDVPDGHYYTCVQHAIMDKADLSRVYLNAMSVQGLCFDGMKLCGANLAYASAQGASFRGADLANANLELSNIERCDFRGANLYGVNFYHSNTKGAIFDPHSLDNLSNFAWHSPELLATIMYEADHLFPYNVITAGILLAPQLHDEIEHHQDKQYHNVLDYVVEVKLPKADVANDTIKVILQAFVKHLRWGDEHIPKVLKYCTDDAVLVETFIKCKGLSRAQAQRLRDYQQGKRKSPVAEIGEE